MKPNEELLFKIKVAVKKNFDPYLQKILGATTEHGLFGMEMVDRLHNQLPATKCGNCGVCCNSISIFSLEYHRIMRDLMTRFDPETIRKYIFSALRFDLRQAKMGKEKRIRCTFRDDDAKTCLIHPVRSFPCRIFGLLKENGKRECDRVSDLAEKATVVTEEFLQNIQSKLLENSEGFEVYPETGEIHYFPFEFWLYRYLFSPERALQIYREIMVPMSTPLTKLWNDPRKIKSLRLSNAKLANQGE